VTTASVHKEIRPPLLCYVLYCCRHIADAFAYNLQMGTLYASVTVSRQKENLTGLSAAAMPVGCCILVYVSLALQSLSTASEPALASSGSVGWKATVYTLLSLCASSLCSRRPPPVPALTSKTYTQPSALPLASMMA
jgi:hypothetical protein